MNDTEKLFEIKEQLYQMLDDYLTYSNNDFEVRIERMIDMIETPSTPCQHKEMYDDAIKQCMGLNIKCTKLNREIEQLKISNATLRVAVSDYKKESTIDMQSLRLKLHDAYESLYDILDREIGW